MEVSFPMTTMKSDLRHDYTTCDTLTFVCGVVFSTFYRTRHPVGSNYFIVATTTETLED